MPTRTDVTDMFIDLVKKGYITPPDQMERMPLPGAYPHVPTILGYTTPEAPIRDGHLRPPCLTFSFGINYRGIESCACRS